MANSLSQVGGPAVAPPGANRSQRQIPFRRATTGRTTQIQNSVGTNVGTPTNSFDVVIEGSGFMYGIDLWHRVTCAGNAAAVAWFEDAPWSTFTSIVLRDVNGELVNLPGFSLRIADLYGGYVVNNAWDNYITPPQGTTTVFDRASTRSRDPLVAYMSEAVGPGDGGSYGMHLYVPVALNRRNLWGLLGNQDRAQKYSLRTDLGSAAAAATGPIYTTAPTTQGTYVLQRHYENYAVPAPTDANGNSQQQIPDKFGIVNFLTQSVNPSVPAAGATINHYLARLGNTIRFMALVLRSAGTRAAAEVAANRPTRIQFNLGDTPLFVETPEFRRKTMFDRYGFDAPQGVYVYDAITDFDGQRASGELGDDYLWTSGLVNAQFAISYPAAGWGAGSSLTVVTGDALIPPSVDIYA